MAQSDGIYTTKEQSLSLLFQNRPNAYSHPGGDTILMERLAQGLTDRGVNVVIDVEGSEDPAKYDLVHLFNFATPQWTRRLAERAYYANTPFVVSTLNEDVSSFHNQSVAVAACLIDYVKQGQGPESFRSRSLDISQISPAPKFDNVWLVKHAAGLFANSHTEAALLRQDYPEAENIYEVNFGCEISSESNQDLFIQTYGEREFILCVARFESRKNQLMLLRALEESALTLILAGGGFSYQAEYETAVLNFKRRGRTIILDRLSNEMLASAYCAAKVHVLPSWYELPGLVSLEAAYYGCNIVATERGSAPDYFGNRALYCDPSSHNSILNAILAAYYSPYDPELKTLIEQYSWDRSTCQTLEAYRNVLGNTNVSTCHMTERPSRKTITAGNSDGGLNMDVQSSGEFNRILERGEEAARTRNYNVAHVLLEQAERLNPGSARALRARAAVLLAENCVDRARGYFERAFSLDSKDAKTLSGLAMCEMVAGNQEQAYSYLLSALELDSGQLVGILQLVECAYALNRFSDLEQILRKYISTHPEDLEIQYCLAGCLYKTGDRDTSQQILEHILANNPNHLGACQLHNIMTQ